METKKNIENYARDTTMENPSRKEMINYGMGFFGIILVWTLLGSFLTYFYTDIVGISAGIIGTMMIIIRIFYGVTDVGMGMIVDRTKSKHGRARPWIIWMTVPLALSTILLFYVPDLSTNGQIVYAYITYTLIILTYTGIAIPYKTLLGLMTQNPKGRSTLNVYNGVFTMSATLAIMTLAQPIATSFDNERLGWLFVASLTAVVIVVTSIISFKTSKERVSYPQNNKVEHVPILKGLKSLFTNKYWLIITAYCVVTYTVNALLTGAGLYYATYILGNGTLFSLLSLGLFIPAIIGFFFIAKVIHRYGKRNVALAASIIAVFGPIIKLIDPSSFYIYLIGNIVQGFSMITVLTLLYAMINDTNEYGAWKDGYRMAGLINSSASFGMKMGTGMGLALIGWLLEYGGYIGTQSTQLDSALSMIIVLNIHIPLVLCILQIILLWMYKLDKQYPSILADLKNREGK